MKRIVLLSLASFFVLTTPASAEVPPAHAGVHSPSVDTWIEGVSRNLSQALNRPGVHRFGDEPLSGAFLVRFECAPDGAPHKIALVSRSGSQLTSRAALRAVQSLPNLHPLPAVFKEDQQYHATIIFARSAEEASRLQGSLREKTDQVSVATSGAAANLAVNIVAVTPG